MKALELVVRGQPVPQGALTRSPSGGLYNSGGKRLTAWRTAIAGVANDHLAGASPLEGPVRVDVTFVMPRPDAHYLPANSRRSVRILRADAPVWFAQTPDIDKLVRACLDALSTIAFRDDGQVADLRARMVYETPELRVGAAIRVSTLPVTA